jgi:hypothetical protein
LYAKTVQIILKYQKKNKTKNNTKQGLLASGGEGFANLLVNSSEHYIYRGPSLLTCF